jgi:hypothetical protein
MCLNSGVLVRVLKSWILSRTKPDPGPKPSPKSNPNSYLS